MVKNNLHITVGRTTKQRITYTVLECTHLCANPKAIALISLLGRPAKKVIKVIHLEALMLSTDKKGYQFYIKAVNLGRIRNKKKSIEKQN